MVDIEVASDGLNGFRRFAFERDGEALRSTTIAAYPSGHRAVTERFGGVGPAAAPNGLARREMRWERWLRRLEERV